MVNYVLSALLFRIVMPILILTCVVFRPCIISGVYLLFMLVSASLPVPTRSSMSGRTGVFLKLLIMITLIVFLGIIVFHLLLLWEFGPYGEPIKQCNLVERILRTVGLVKLNALDAPTILLWIMPEVIMLPLSIVFYIVFAKLTRTPVEPEDGLQKVSLVNRKAYINLFINIGKLVVICTLCLAGIFKPSIPGGVYFLVFLSIATWLGCFRSLHKGFAIVMKILMVIVFFHIYTLYAYQTEWPQLYLSEDSNYARWFGISKMMYVNCDADVRVFEYTSKRWTEYANVISLLILYFAMAVMSRQLFKPAPAIKQGTFSRLEGGSFNKGPLSRQLSQRLSDRRLRRSATRTRWQNATRKVRMRKRRTEHIGESTPLMHDGRQRLYNSKVPSMIQDSTGSVIIAADSDIPMQDAENWKTDNLDDVEVDESVSCFEKFILAMEAVILFCIRTSYVATNIIMMVWSITYHSWITFVLLLWSSFLWMVPNQRKHTLRSSPFLVLYAWFLLVSAYAYSMDLTEDELPSTIAGWDLPQIGFVRNTENPYVSLLVKCLYTVMFWVTLRQYMKERKEARQNSALTDIFAPVQLTVGAATGVDHVSRLLTDNQKSQKVYPAKLSEQAAYLSTNTDSLSIKTALPDEGVPQDDEKAYNVMRQIMAFQKRFLTRTWIWIVAIILFWVAITGQRMTSFRILYMFLFLIFLLCFQFSFKLWRKIMFGFLLTVIIYSMIILVLIYTYQFDNFNIYWEKYLHVSEQQQLDIGLEKYQTKQLFIRLVTPTCFVIITAIQLHYFHKDFLEMTKPVSGVADSTKSEAASSAQGGQGRANIEEPESEDEEIDLTNVENISAVQVHRKFRRFCRGLYFVFNLICLALEIHMPKLVMIVAIIVTAKDVCAIHFFIVVLMVLGSTIGKQMVNLSIYMTSFISSVMLITRMIYQIEYIQHNNWNVTCEITNGNETKIYENNTAEWIGYYKIANGRDVPESVKWNIVMILVVTFWCVINVRQQNYRASLGLSIARPYFIFPKIRIGNAHSNLKSYLMYLCNFMFYRLGVEICLIATVAVIGLRMDFYALLYSLFLLTFFSLKRPTLAKFWNVYLVTLALAIPIQYFMVIGLPPDVCINYPWNSSDILRKVQEWGFLMDRDYPPAAKKIICDFVLLILVYRQSLVFRIERRYEGDEYVGGSNKEITENIENNPFSNPFPDFITFSRTYLDIFKRIFFLPLIWITLAIVFLAGANRVNVFSLGYLIGSFYFLWIGSDIYLRPLDIILEKWNYLVLFNVLVIVVKIVLQFVGCVFYDHMKDNACWVIQLLGIFCLRKFKTNYIPLSLNPDEECVVPREYVGLAWDGACFAFLILQRRLFHSYDFFHIVNESKASAILASRGAELIEELREKRMIDQDAAEKRIIEKIKTKMDRIKANQQKILGPSYKDPETHHIEQLNITRTPSMSSCVSASQHTTTPAGYHTPIDEEEPEPQPQTPQTTTNSQLNQTNAPSPFSALMTGSLEAYLDPQRISFSSPPNSELNPRPPSPDDSFPVFSPPPYDDAPPYAEVSEQTTVVERQESLIGPPWMAGKLCTPRQSVISYSSRSPMSHHTYTIYPKSNRPLYRRKEPKSYKAAIRSGDYYMFDDFEHEELDIFEDLEKPEDIEDELTHSHVTVGEFISKSLKDDVATTLRQRRASTAPEQGHSSISQLSMPYSAPPAVNVERIPRSEDRELEEPEPSTSKEPFDTSDEEQKVSIKQKIMNMILFVYQFMQSLTYSLSRFLYKFSKDHRYVIRVLTNEKRILKESTDYTNGTREAPNYVWKPAYKAHTLISSRVNECSSNSDKQVAIATDVDTKPQTHDTPPDYAATQESDTKQAEMSSADQPVIYQLMLSIWYIILGHSDFLCFFIIFLNQIKNATFISLPLPMMVFLWGTLTVPRPSKTFWVTIIAYTQVIVILKCIFQFKLIPWNVDEPNTLDITSMIGIERKKNYALWDLILLLVVYFHRYMLKCLGLWHLTYEHTEVYKDGEYTLRDGELHSHELQPEKKGPSSRFGTVVRNRWFLSASLTIIRRIITHERRRKFFKVKAKKYRGHSMTFVATETCDKIYLRKGSGSNEPEDEMVLLSSSSNHPGDMFPSSVKMIIERYNDNFKEFFSQLFDPTSRVAADVYTYMFLCDFFNFFVIIVGFSAFGSQQSGGSVAAVLQDNRVPALFLVMMISQFILIIVDRAIFLRKNIVAKIIFQFLQILFLHVWLFIIFPYMTERNVNSVIPPQMYYMVKCFYLLLSAYQIRCGYPARILGNFICKGYGFLNLTMFKTFMFVPFLFELRTIMDWMWTDTSMTVFDWVKMEDIFAHIYQLKCSRYMEEEYPQPRGVKKKGTTKYLMGGCVLLLIVGAIWFPLVFFSLGNAVGESNTPYDVTFSLRLGPYEPFYKTSAQSNSIFQFSEEDFDLMQQRYIRHREATTLLNNYIYSDVAAVKLSFDSATVWSISPPDKERMIEEVRSAPKLRLHMMYEISHKTNSKDDNGVMRKEIVDEIEDSPNMTNPIRENFLRMLTQPASNTSILLKYMFPKFVKVTNRGITDVLTQFMDPYPDESANALRNVTLKLSMQMDKLWWTIEEVQNDFNYKKYLQYLPDADKNSFMMYTFNDKIFPATLNVITGGGIIGLYTTLVFVASRVLRGFFSEICFKIMFDDMPNVDRVLQLCADVYLVREAGEFALEEDLFAKLVFLYRSPETLIKWTRPIEEAGDDDPDAPE